MPVEAQHAGFPECNQYKEHSRNFECIVVLVPFRTTSQPDSTLGYMAGASGTENVLLGSRRLAPIPSAGTYSDVNCPSRCDSISL